MQGFSRVSLLPPIIKILLFVNIGIFFVQTLFLDTFHVDGIPLSYYLIKYFALNPLNISDFSLVSSAVNDPSIGTFWPWQIITYQFLHGDFWHVAFNMFALWMFGTELESLWGSKRFLTFYILSGIGASIVQLFIASVPTIGASGSVFGILLAFGLTFPSRPIFMFPFFIPIPARIFVIIYAGIALISGFGSNDGVAHFAHLGGAVTGWFLLKYGDKLKIYEFFNKFYPDKNFDKNRGYDPGYKEQNQQQESARVFRVNWMNKEKQQESYPEPQSSKSTKTYNIDGEDITQDKIDAILDKISETGYANLTDKEKYILNELSKKL